MRLSHRLVGSLVLAVAVASLGFALVDVHRSTTLLEEELARRASAAATHVEQSLGPYLKPGQLHRATDVIDRLRTQEGLAGVLVFDSADDPIVRAPVPDDDLLLKTRAVVDDANGANLNVFVPGAHGRLLIHTLTTGPATSPMTVALIYDASYIDHQKWQLWRDQLGRVALEAGLIVLITLLLLRSSVDHPLARIATWLKARRLGLSPMAPLAEGDFVRPLLGELMHLVGSLEGARASAAEEARLRDAAESVWTAERLRANVRGRLDSSPLFVVSNREPYLHMKRDGVVTTVVPASGLVTALEPVLRACDGTWIAHGSGDADRERVDAHDRLRVPPDHPEYTLRRVWLTQEEEEGYYYGFSNEGLWPLCHIAHTRPLFRESDWVCYQRANRHFADAVIDELTTAETPLVLVQDYHFALLPRLITARRPDARVGVFWHIPWPNAEAFGICPWQNELLDGLLGADLVGFHTQAHCNNFLETVDRAFESQIEWEQFTARRHNHVTQVRPFPISVDPGALAPSATAPPSRTSVLEPLGVSAELLGVGVDRIDYTKGLLERFQALERFFEKWNGFIGRFTFVQIAAPSRTHIPRYQKLVDDVTSEAARINARFGTARWKPIVLLTRHHSHAEIAPYYRAADLCAVTALHDGMNLVAKEFVTSRDDGDGVLILSRFTGAARELPDALIVNPYDIEQLADAFRRAIDMPHDERSVRMNRMRRTVREHNVYKWAATLIGDLADVRIEVNRPERQWSPSAAEGSLLTGSGHDPLTVES
jgi:trehalose 6-phosphate synthase